MITGIQIGQSLKITTQKGALLFRYASLEGREGLVITSESTLPKRIKVRIHSSCVFGEVFHALECDCNDQLNAALDSVIESGGVVIYLFDEGRGIGLEKKIEAISLEKKEGLNTAEAFERLGYKSDPRSFTLAIEILKGLFFDFEIELITNNPHKINEVKLAGLNVVSIEKTIHINNEMVARYLLDKRDNLGHNI